MSNAYRAVQWNRHKRLYDACIGAGVGLFLLAFIGAGRILFPGATDETLIIRALGACAFLLLHIILAIGPLARLSPRFAPLLYNRRHLGVSMFLLALGHAAFSLFQWHGFGNANVFISLLTANTRAGSLSQFPFEWLGLAALVILFVMASTSHDFWLANLTPRVWKSLHMAVYAAYALLVMHVALGFMQSERSWLYPAMLGAGAGGLIALHLLAALRESRFDRHAIERSRVRKNAVTEPLPSAADVAPVAAAPGSEGQGVVAREGFVDVCAVADIAPDRARVVCLAGAGANGKPERIAIFRHGEGGSKVSAISNVCAHQQGPLGEGKIIDGCVTCPWHGYQYLPHNGQSPPPFSEKIPTYQVRVVAGRVLVNPRPNAPGADVEPAIAEDARL